MSRSFATPWTEACQVPLSMGFPRQEHWSVLPFPYDLYTDLEQGLSLSKCGVILDGISLFLGTRPTMFSSPQDSILSALWGCCVLGLLPFIFFFLSWRLTQQRKKRVRRIERVALKGIHYHMLFILWNFLSAVILKNGCNPQIHAMLSVLPYEGHLYSSGRQSLRYKEWTSKRNS